ncbi:hypothetical protein DPMN_020012 [Dreissena polymorpha]|nr:hypothetical protein DPMN_063361 [Dreissena polymorpha]KAH3895845.1 hypothetical protein DPMN_020012 [Dreissena polymorpha]
MPITTKLFGDDVTKDLKACDSMFNIGSGKPWWKSKTLRPTHRPYRGSSNYSNYGGAGVGRFQPYPQRGGRPFRRGLSGGSFRGRGGYGQSPSGK